MSVQLVRDLVGDLVRDALAWRPLPPLARLPLPARARRALPGAAGEALRRAPQAAVLALTVLLLVFHARSDVPQTERLVGGALALGAVLLALCLPVLAGWLLVAATAVSVFHPGGLAGPFPFADVTSWPRLLFYDSQQRPWAMAGLLVFAAVLALLALRLRLRAVVALWCLLVAVAVAGNGPLSVGAWVMALVSAPMPLTALVVTGLREARAEAASHAAATEEERARRLLLEERAVIARELHDVVAHHMSVVAIQAEAAPYRVQDPPPELAKAFADVRENAVAALAELRRVLGVVRAEPPSPYGPPGAGKEPDADPDTDADADADTAAGARGARELTGVRGEFGGDVRASRGVEAPQPTLAGLDALLAGVRAVGPYAAKTVTGEVRQLPRGVELSAYRIVQEALSNAMRHAPGAEVGVELAYERDGLGLRVVNGPSLRPPSPSPGAGHGLTGMRERVTMLGGRLRTGPTGEGGYEVRGFLPCEGHLEPGTVPASPAAPVPGPGEERTDG